MKIITSFIFLILLDTSLSLSERDPNVIQIKNIFRAGKTCITGALYNAVRKNTEYMKYYCQFVCSRFKSSGNPNYLAQTYGHKGKELGSGSFGVVYKYTLGSNDFAIKIPKNFKYKGLFEELNTSNCVNEGLEGNSIMKFMGTVKECISPNGNDPHLVMDFYPATLEDKMEKEYTRDVTTYSIEKKIRLFTDMYYLAAELRAVHKLGIAHRDMKPENAMINDQGTPVLVDFGMGTLNFLDAKTRCGSPLFMDPDLVAFRSDGGATADVYALGIIFYMMMTGSTASSTIEGILIGGGYGTAYYNPDLSKLNLYGDKTFIANMIRQKGHSQPARWNMEETYQFIKQKLKELVEQEKQGQAQSYAMTKQPTYVSPEPTTQVTTNVTQKVVIPTNYNPNVNAYANNNAYTRYVEKKPVTYVVKGNQPLNHYPNTRQHRVYQGQLDNVQQVPTVQRHIVQAPVLNQHYVQQPVSRIYIRQPTQKIYV